LRSLYPDSYQPDRPTTPDGGGSSLFIFNVRYRLTDRSAESRPTLIAVGFGGQAITINGIQIREADLKNAYE